MGIPSCYLALYENPQPYTYLQPAPEWSRLMLAYNDQDPDKAGDSRWLHRGHFDWERAEQRRVPNSVVNRIFQGTLRLIQLRHQNPAFNNATTEFTETGNIHVLGYFSNHEQYSVFVLANFSEQEQILEARRLRLLGLRKTMVDLYAGRTITATQELKLEPYQLLVLSRGM